MKRHMKLMRVYEIEKDYQLHKQRLHSIKFTDNRTKIISEVCSNIERINNFKKIKISSENFAEKQKNFRINTENNNLREKMEEVNTRPAFLGREKLKILRQGSVNRKSLREGNSSKKNGVFGSLSNENCRMKERLSKTKSNYYKIAKSLNHSQLKKHTRQEEMIYLLEKQLKITPNVVFPALKSRGKPSRLQQRPLPANSFVGKDTQANKDKSTGEISPMAGNFSRQKKPFFATSKSENKATSKPVTADISIL